MTTQIDQLTGSGPTSTPQTSFSFNTDDTNAGTTAKIATPTANGTNFSFVKTFIMEITNAATLSMTNILVGKVAAESTTGTVVWRGTSHALAAYIQATVAPTSTIDNNVTAPSINAATAVALELIAAPPATYAAGPFNTTGQKGNLVELALGVDTTNTTAGTAVATPTIRWSWTEG